MGLRTLKNRLRKNKIIYLTINFSALCVQLGTRAFFRGISFFIPIKNNRILFRAYEGRGYTCSPKYISECIKSDKAYEIIWAFNNPELYSSLKDDGIITVKRGSLKYIYYYVSSKVIVFNDLFESFLPTGKGQVYINTWHGGGAYKKWGMLLNWNWMGRLRYYLTHKFTYFLSSCRLYTQYASQAFSVDESQFIDSGLPRNDMFFMDESSLQTKRLNILSKLNLDPAFKYVLYAPTYREFQGNSTYNIDFSILKAALEKRFGGEWMILFRGHYYLDPDNILPDYVMDVSEHDDMQEILLVSDVLITDYSSSIWDFSLLKRPCFLYTPDKPEYEAVTNFCTPLEEWPYTFSLTNQELMQHILDYDEQQHLDCVYSHQLKLGIYETGSATNRVVEIISDIINR